MQENAYLLDAEGRPQRPDVKTLMGKEVMEPM